MQNRTEDGYAEWDRKGLSKRTTLFFSSKIPFFHLSLDFWKFDVASSNFSSMKMLFIDGAILQLKFYECREINYTTSRNIERYLSIN